MCACTKLTAMAPSPTAAATRLVDPLLTSPAAKTPGRLVSSRKGVRPEACQRSLPAVSWGSEGPVTTKPLRSKSTQLRSHSVLGSAPMKRKSELVCKVCDSDEPVVSCTALRWPLPSSAVTTVRWYPEPGGEGHAACKFPPSH